MRASYLCVGVAFAVAGCAATPPKHSGLTLDNALKDLGKGLYDMHNQAHPPGSDNKPFGLFAEEVTVTFNVTASKSSSNADKLYIDLDASVPSIPISAGAGASSETTQQSTHTRGNTIVIKFLNPYFAPPDTAIYAAVSPFPPAGSSSGTKAVTNPSPTPDSNKVKPTTGSGNGSGDNSQAPTMPLNGNGIDNFTKIMQFIFGGVLPEPTKQPSGSIGALSRTPGGIPKATSSSDESNTVTLPSPP